MEVIIAVFRQYPLKFINRNSIIQCPSLVSLFVLYHWYAEVGVPLTCLLSLVLVSLYVLKHVRLLGCYFLRFKFLLCFTVLCSGLGFLTKFAYACFLQAHAGLKYVYAYN